LENELPVSKATNLYDLLDDVVTAAEEEPKRFDQGWWIGRYPTVTWPPNSCITAHIRDIGAPACGVVGCTAGWIVVLSGNLPNTLDWNNPDVGSFVRNVAARMLGRVDVEGIGRDISSLFGGLVHEKDDLLFTEKYDKWNPGEIVERGDSRYIPLVVARIRGFQRKYEEGLRAAPVVVPVKARVVDSVIVEDRIHMAGDFPAAAPREIAGGLVCDTPQAIERYRMIAVLQGLSLESKGIRMSRRGSALATARRLYGVKARTAAVAYTRMRELMLAHGIIVEGE
jgi:hypothetical protein